MHLHSLWSVSFVVSNLCMFHLLFVFAVIQQSDGMTSRSSCTTIPMLTSILDAAIDEVEVESDDDSSTITVQMNHDCHLFQALDLATKSDDKRLPSLTSPARSFSLDNFRIPSVVFDRLAAPLSEECEPFSTWLPSPERLDAVTMVSNSAVKPVSAKTVLESAFIGLTPNPSVVTAEFSSECSIPSPLSSPPLSVPGPLISMSSSGRPCCLTPIHISQGPPSPVFPERPPSPSYEPPPIPFVPLPTPPPFPPQFESYPTFYSDPTCFALPTGSAWFPMPPCYPIQPLLQPMLPYCPISLFSADPTKQIFTTCCLQPMQSPTNPFLPDRPAPPAAFINFPPQMLPIMTPTPMVPELTMPPNLGQSLIIPSTTTTSINPIDNPNGPLTGQITWQGFFDAPTPYPLLHG